MNDVRAEFIVESREHLAVFERSLLSLEKAASGAESRVLIQHGLRAMHSLKGDSGFLGFATIRQLAHAMESLLEDYRDGARLPSTNIVEALLAARDQLAALVEDLDQSQQATVDDMVRRLQRLEGTSSHAIPLHINLRHWQAGELRILDSSKCFQSREQIRQRDSAMMGQPMPQIDVQWNGIRRCSFQTLQPTNHIIDGCLLTLIQVLDHRRKLITSRQQRFDDIRRW